MCQHACALRSHRKGRVVLVALAATLAAIGANIKGREQAWTTLTSCARRPHVGVFATNAESSSVLTSVYDQLFSRDVLDWSVQLVPFLVPEDSNQFVICWTSNHHPNRARTSHANPRQVIQPKLYTRSSAESEMMMKQLTFEPNLIGW